MTDPTSFFVEWALAAVRAFLAGLEGALAVVTAVYDAWHFVG